MDSPREQQRTNTVYHVVAVTHPSRSHINSLMNFCKLLASQEKDILVTFVLTQEWLRLIGSDSKPGSIRFAAIPNVIPSEHVRVPDMDAFFDAVINELHSEKRNERVDYIPGVSRTRPADLPRFVYESNQKILDLLLNSLSWVPIAQYLLFPGTFYELETPTIDVLRSELSLPIYTMGPSIPYSRQNDLPTPVTSDDSYFRWLDSQPCTSVLYIGMGSFLSFSSAQIDEIAAGLRNSGVQFISRGESERLKEACGDMRLVVPSCDQLRVLRHSSIGGFLSYCGWNSVMEGVSAGVIFLT